MTYQGRALYNLLQMNLKHNPAMEVEKWQVENYRDIAQEELFQRLEKMEIFLSEENFLLYVEECDSPEDLADPPEEEFGINLNKINRSIL